MVDCPTPDPDPPVRIRITSWADAGYWSFRIPRVAALLPPCAADQIQRNWLLGFITAWLESLPEAEPVENGRPLYALLGGTLWRDRPLLLELLPIALELMKDPS
ncbi:MAG: hypothetical protein EOM91_18850, partial [Sphingobacteriia bacterium]|nr:hypothetical protein [Sphingobacteriia bacterium]NCC41456.1 hypothetical protein [Gammaproteobacteria bacterium]